ncbi:putative CBF/NF-Y family transcription factor [Aspergillus novofumigatus IBT 16806]|uniref:DNA polymerase epsilon subunit D n=1 Tax=Aspergillus novofumigatus (strain IBT 16806) TaxID=1392255 RepID=A0A2I1C9P5_ASPN1|nr:histone-fold-containing protein [Aspergillus novofumigatus IBT 16806]PKX94316.1 histone-fold-containing protein [Aspergillus novofumigatus IBT 16806]
MPTRKSTDVPTDTDGPSPQPQTQTSPVQNVQATEQQLKARAEGVSIEDYLLPRSLTLRLAKAVLPPNTAIQKDAVLAIQKAATVFVSYLASHANEATLKRTVTPADVFAALSEMEFEAFQPRLEKELEAFTEMKAGKRKGRKSGSGQTREDDEESAVREAKRVKRVEGVGPSSAQAGEEEEDDDDTQEEQEQALENEEEVDEDEEDEDEDEDEEEDEDETQEEDIDRVEDLDRDSRPRRTMDPDAADETESEDESGPGTQLQSGLGLG